MKLYVPEISDLIRLTADWTFNVYCESRNYSLMEFVKDPRKRTWTPDTEAALPTTIPAGEVLRVDRVYIRKGQSDFSSLTFYWKDRANPSKMVERDTWDRALNKYVPSGQFDKIPKEPIRFWAKLEDVNKIEFEPV